MVAGARNQGNEAAEAEHADLPVVDADEAVGVVDPETHKVLDDGHGVLAQGGGDSALDGAVENVVVMDQGRDGNLREKKTEKWALIVLKLCIRGIQ